MLSVVEPHSSAAAFGDRDQTQAQVDRVADRLAVAVEERERHRRLAVRERDRAHPGECLAAPGSAEARPVHALDHSLISLEGANARRRGGSAQALEFIADFCARAGPAGRRPDREPTIAQRISDRLGLGMGR